VPDGHPGACADDYALIGRPRRPSANPARSHGRPAASRETRESLPCSMSRSKSSARRSRNGWRASSSAAADPVSRVAPRHTNNFVDIRINSYNTRSVASPSPSKEPAPPPLPTDSEVAILAVLWRQGASTVREVHDALGKDSGYTSTLKLMQLMLEKGLVVRNERYRSHLYEAREPKERTQRQIAGDLLKRAFEGSAKSLVLGALAAQPASGKDLAEIRSLLDELEKREKK
jgi:BlaI family transcriptional regulator, penicillinase repressor